jgi:hypothetical protein
MKTITIREFQHNLYKYFDNLPLTITRHGIPFIKVTSLAGDPTAMKYEFPIQPMIRTGSGSKVDLFRIRVIARSFLEAKEEAERVFGYQKFDWEMFDEIIPIESVNDQIV